MKALVAGVGNVLRGDDGFGVAVAERLAHEMLPPDLYVSEFGIGGIHLVQQLIDDQFDLLIVVDSVEMGRPPGTVMVVRPDIEDVWTLSMSERHDRVADMHLATPDRAMMVARALGVLPEQVWVVGCEPLDAHSMHQGLSEPVERAVPAAVSEIKDLTRQHGISW